MQSQQIEIFRFMKQHCLEKVFVFVMAYLVNLVFVLLSLVFGTLCLVIWSQYALAVLQCPLCVITSKLMSHCAEDFGD